MTVASNSVSVSWDNVERTILRFDFEPGWSWLDVHHALEQAGEMIDDTPYYQVAAIFVPSAINLQANIISIIRKDLLRRNPRIEPIIIASDNKIVRNLFELLLQLKPDLQDIMYFVDTVDDAYAFIESELVNQFAF